jgi:pimeloyl-ACP methyl ester carboxylesterase
MDWCGNQPAIKAWAAGQGTSAEEDKGAGGLRFLLAGHSRGGKTSVLAATADRAEGRDRVCGLVLIDPADGSYDAVEGPRCGGTPCTDLRAGSGSPNKHLLGSIPLHHSHLHFGHRRNSSADSLPPSRA